MHTPMMITQRLLRASHARAILALLLVCIASGLSLGATSEQVDKALDLARKFIYSQQKGGLWEDHPAPPTKKEIEQGPAQRISGQWGGDTALAVYALLAAGESPNDPKLAKAIDFLENADLTGTYALGLRSQLYPFLPPSQQVKRFAQADVMHYLNGISVKGKTLGMFDYSSRNLLSTRNDHSVSQYAVLGAWACARAGVEIPINFWKIVEQGWIRDQNPQDGSWGYTNETDITRQPTASMVAAGVATLLITQDYVHNTNGVNCSGNIVNPNVDAGIKWLGDHFEHVFTDSASMAPYYAIYGVSRVGVASGRKYLGPVDWYARGSDWLIEHQSPTGDWVSSMEQTAFATLFLARGHAPVVFNKLQYDSDKKEGNWNERPRDIANLTHWIAKETERDLNWQIVNLKVPATELLDAPVLYISGNKPLELSAEDEAKLKEYCEDGGLIMANADCTNSNFVASFRKLGTKLFHTYEFRELPPTHPIYTNEQYSKKLWKTPISVLSLSNGVRELMTIAPNTDSGRYWQIEETGRALPDYQLADNILLYAIDKTNLREKGKLFTEVSDPKIATTRTIKVARLQFEGNWDPEPGGWRRLAAIFHNKFHTSLDVSVIKLGSGGLSTAKANGLKFASLTGTFKSTLTSVERQDLKDFVDAGGTLVVDSAGGDSDFASSIEGELQTAFGPGNINQISKRLLETDGVFNLPGNEIKKFGYRPFAKNTLGTLHGPMLAVITVNNRPAVYYSRIDLSAGLVGQPTDGIIGYDPDTATAIMTNLVLASQTGLKTQK
jgi:hypothetical protein